MWPRCPRSSSPGKVGTGYGGYHQGGLVLAKSPLGYTQGREGSKDVGPIGLDSWSLYQLTDTLKQPIEAVEPIQPLGDQSSTGKSSVPFPHKTL